MKDNFSKLADIYVKYRPTYPQELFDFIFSYVKNNDAAWDCGTGNGQTAKELSRHFKKVVATDISQKQIDKAYQANNIIYSLQPAEQTNFTANNLDLITISQALHWFKFEEFYAEVKRVAKNSGIIAAWCYSLPAISKEIDQIVNTQLYKNTLGQYWDEERQYVDDHYATIPFPFEEIKTPSFQIISEWTVIDLEGYINSWSALQKFITANNYNPVDKFIEQVKPYWKEKMKVVFPIHLRIGRVEK